MHIRSCARAPTRTYALTHSHRTPANLGVGEVAGARAAVILELAVTDAEGVGRLPVVGGAGVMGLVPRQGREPVARARAAVHGRNRGPWLGVFVHHLGSLFEDTLAYNSDTLTHTHTGTHK